MRLLSEREVRFLKRSYFQDVGAKKYKGQILDFTLPLVGKQSYNDRYIHYKIKSASNFHIVGSKESSNIDNLTQVQYERIMPKPCRDIYLSISRYIRKNILFKHNSCLKKLILHGDFEDIDLNNTCSFAYSYSMWKKSVEGQLNFSSVDNGSKRVRNPHDVDHLSNHLFNEILKDFKTNIFEYSGLKRYNIYKWVLYRVLGHVLYYWYWNLAYYSNCLINQKEKHIDFNIVEANIPFFLLVFPEVPNEQM